MSEGRVRYSKNEGVATVLFDRPEARNAMTWAMYEGLAAACDAIASEADVRVAVFRGAGGAFVAGTDIQQFTAFKDGEDGIAYERRIDAAIDKIERVAKPIIAVVEGFCVGGGIAIAMACDFRIAAPSARFGVPIARTLGNCLSVGNVARLVAQFGPGRTKRMLMLAEMISAEEAKACGFVDVLAAEGDIETKLAEMCKKLLGHAHITMRNAKEAIRRIRTANLPDGADLIRDAYGSADFKEGVEAFLAKRAPNWQGR
ncbi:MAG TPA: enoyl-CoA hydratase/isomerase family protein [Micropepsaceae bacterium]|jgi:enoyl-CoA hydratase/carnithine racemase|nr:enoyl-CoA hydratase/isomerase family protein [Micropepsaceae bacterium]